MITRSRPIRCAQQTPARTHTHPPTFETEHLIGKDKTGAKVSYFGSSQRQHNPFIDAFYFTVAKHQPEWVSEWLHGTCDGRWNSRTRVHSIAPKTNQSISQFTRRRDGNKNNANVPKKKKHVLGIWTEQSGGILLSIFAKYIAGTGPCDADARVVYNSISWAHKRSSTANILTHLAV